MFFMRHPFLVFFLFSLSEAILLAKVGTLIGWGWTILAIVATAMIGSAMWRQQGLETWRRVNQRMAQGELPGQELIEGVMLIVGGALLITPGFITDTIGFFLLFPVTRKAAAKSLFDKGLVQGWSQQGGFRQAGGFGGFYQSGPGERVWVYEKHETRTDGQVIDSEADSSSSTKRDDGVIEGEFIPKGRR